MATSKEEYLKRYLSVPSGEKKTKKKSSQRSKRQPGLQIHDDDVDFKSLLPSNLKNTIDDDVEDDNPVVVELGLDKRDRDLKELERMRNSKQWRLIAQDDDEPKASSTDDRKGKAKRRFDSDCDSDNSPPRQQKRLDDSSPPRKQKQNLDNSPPRKINSRNRQADDSDASPPRQRKRLDDDNSPVRNRKKNSNDSDSSPPRKVNTRNVPGNGSDISPPRRRRNYSDNSDASPPRRPRDSHEPSSSKQNKENPKVIYRKDGKKRDLEAEQKAKDEEDAKKARLTEKYTSWNKGLKQGEIAEERLAFALREVEKPLARYKDDEDLDLHLKDREREGDPMLAYIKKKQSNSSAAAKPRYRGPQPPPNRYNLYPGYRWDGVDRSNGFEKKYFSKLSDDKARQEMAHKWSVEDM